IRPAAWLRWSGQRSGCSEWDRPPRRYESGATRERGLRRLVYSRAAAPPVVLFLVWPVGHPPQRKVREMHCRARHRPDAQRPQAWGDDLTIPSLNQPWQTWNGLAEWRLLTSHTAIIIMHFS